VCARPSAEAERRGAQHSTATQHKPSLREAQPRRTMDGTTRARGGSASGAAPPGGPPVPAAASAASTPSSAASSTSSSSSMLAQAGVLQHAGGSMSNYKILQTIGRGNFGVCHLCECIDASKSVAANSLTVRARSRTHTQACSTAPFALDTQRKEGAHCETMRHDGILLLPRARCNAEQHRLSRRLLTPLFGRSSDAALQVSAVQAGGSC
jgi:hypothetical protein